MAEQKPGESPQEPFRRKRAPNENILKLGSGGAGSSPTPAAPTVPLEALDTVFEFLDGNGLLSCESVSYCWRCATDRISLWKRACISAFPHLGDPYLASPNAGCGAYEGDWRETFLDGNRENRSAVLDWDLDMAAGADEADALPDGNPEEERRYFPPFSLCGYSFRLLADPRGNPRAIDLVQAPGERPVQNGLSVYLMVAFQNGLQDTPPWGDELFSSHGFPPPPMQLGYGHPWGAREKEEQTGNNLEVGGGEEGDELARGAASDLTSNGALAVERGAGAAAENGAGNDSAAFTGFEGAKAEPKTTAAMRVKRDPHGLRHRRRRSRTREGRAALVSHVGDASAIARECCVAFSFAAVNKAEGKDMNWISSMKCGHFFPGRSSWGVHCLLPTSTIQDTEAGFLTDGSLTVRLRIRLLFLTVHVYTTADLASHRGFGVVAVRGRDQPFHYHRDGGGEEGEREEHSRRLPRSPAADSGQRPSSENSTPVGGPLPCLTFEVLRWTTPVEMQNLVARTLKVSCNDIRLWVITQPQPDSPLAPRQLLSGMPAGFVDDTPSFPSLLHLLYGDTMNEACRRLWVEHRGDGGFWETETEHIPPTAYFWQQQQHVQDAMETSLGGGGGGRYDGGRPGISPPTPIRKCHFAGVWLARTADVSPAQMQLLSTMFSGLPGSTGSDEPPEQAGAGAEVASALDPTVPVGAGVVTDEVDGLMSASDGRTEIEEELILVFLKTLRLGNSCVQQHAASASTPAAGKEHFDGSSSDASGVGAKGSGDSLPRYLTHAVLRGSSPLRSLFELTAELLEDGTAPEDLGAYVEDLPWVWQREVLRSQTDSVITGRLLGGAPDSGAANDRLPKTCRRFLACPPVVSTISPSLPEGQSKSLSGISTLPEAAADAVIAAEQEANGESFVALTLEEAGLSPGASICFFRAGQEANVRKTYATIVKESVEEMRMLQRREGPLGRVHHIKLAEVLEICESLGYQGFRARTVHDQQRHVNGRETLEYVARGRHLAFICDSCGTQDFSGPRYHCQTCPDYDLCQECNAKREPAPRHRYKFTYGLWTREGGFHGHTDDHELEEIFTVPADGCERRRRHQG